MKLHKKIFVFLLIMVLVLPLGYFLGIKEKIRIYGVEQIYEYASLQEKSYLDKSFQNNFEKWWQTHFLFRRIFLLLKNQMYDWSNFGKIHSGYMNTIIQGENQWLYLTSYLPMYREINPKIKLQINEQLDNIAECCNKLESLNKNVYFIFAPDKVVTYPEWLPKRFLLFLDGNCNYTSRMSLYLSNKNVNVLDGQKLAIKYKNSSEIPFFYKTGIHWNLYGAGVIMINAAQIFNWGDVEIETCQFSESPYFSERDIANLLNLIFQYQTNEKYCKPVYRFHSGMLTGTTSVIGNSFSNEFYMNLINSKLLTHENSKQFENRPLTSDDLDYIVSSKNIIFICTAASMINPTHQFYKKINLINEFLNDLSKGALN